MFGKGPMGFDRFNRRDSLKHGADIADWFVPWGKLRHLGKIGKGRRGAQFGKTWKPWGGYTRIGPGKNIPLLRGARGGRFLPPARPRTYWYDAYIHSLKQRFPRR